MQPSDLGLPNNAQWYGVRRGRGYKWSKAKTLGLALQLFEFKEPVVLRTHTYFEVAAFNGKAHLDAKLSMVAGPIEAVVEVTIRKAAAR